MNGFFSVWSCVSIVLTLCCISTDRYVAVTRPIKYKTIVTVKRAFFALIVVWTQGILCGMLPMWGWARYEYHPGTLHCSPSWNDNCSLYVFLSVVGFALPVFVMVVTYTKIFLTIRKHERKVTTKRWNRQAKTRDKPNFFNKCKNDISVLSSPSLRPNGHVTLFKTDTCADRFTATPTKLFSQDEFTCDEQNQNILPRNVSIVSDRSTCLVNESILFRNTRTSRIACAKISEQRVSDDSAWRDTQKPISKQKTSSTKQPESRRKVSSLIHGLRSHLGSRQGFAERTFPREYKVAKTGFMLLIAFLVLWAPYLVVHSCSDKFKFASTVFHVAMWCVYMNGVANPVVYALSNRSVKLAFTDMLRKARAVCYFAKK